MWAETTKMIRVPNEGLKKERKAEMMITASSGREVNAVSALDGTASTFYGQRLGEGAIGCYLTSRQLLSIPYSDVR